MLPFLLATALDLRGLFVFLGAVYLIVLSLLVSDPLSLLLLLLRLLWVLLLPLLVLGRVVVQIRIYNFLFLLDSIFFSVCIAFSVLVTRCLPLIPLLDFLLVLGLSVHREILNAPFPALLPLVFLILQEGVKLSHVLSGVGGTIKRRSD